ncbi:MAG: hypothetical protein K2X81_01005 [Candidatus Obscuribacterales bacterium]|nr:hypothetical protein [Candidatus Obscuribacterales bacterium]
MKLAQLIVLAQAAELGLAHLEYKHSRLDAQAAINAAHLEASRRRQSRATYRAHRPSRTVRREAIRDELLNSYNKVRLTRDGHWHVQTSPGTAWLLFALNDNDAENSLNT